MAKFKAASGADAGTARTALQRDRPAIAKVVNVRRMVVVGGMYLKGRNDGGLIETFS
jgi:hypothetical protein